MACDTKNSYAVHFLNRKLTQKRLSTTALKGLATGFALLLIAGCQGSSTLTTPFGEPFRAGAPMDFGQSLPHRAYVERGKTFFGARDFGNAQRVYQKAVEIERTDPEAWLGLAASYDRLRRFDQSAFAYKKVHRLLGESSAYYNNRGFSYLLQGKGKAAAANFKKSLELDPGNNVAENNLRLMAKVQDRNNKLR